MSVEAFPMPNIPPKVKAVECIAIAEYENQGLQLKKIPFCKIADKCSPSSCFSTQAISGFLN